MLLQFSQALLSGQRFEMLRNTITGICNNLSKSLRLSEIAFRPFSTSKIHCDEESAPTKVRYKAGITAPTPGKLRGKMVDDSDDITLNIGALSEEIAEGKGTSFQRFPDETTADTLFNGIKFKNLPYITIRCTYNHTRFWINSADGKLLYYTSPKMNGFLNAKKRTAVAAQGMR